MRKGNQIISWFCYAVIGVMMLGCTPRYSYGGTIHDAAAAIEAAGTKKPGTVSDEKQKNSPLDEPIPYSFLNRRRIKNGYHWIVHREVNGIYSYLGKLKVTKKRGTLNINAPTKSLALEIADVLGLEE